MKEVFEPHEDLYEDIVFFCFLLMFISMLTATVLIVYEVRLLEKERRKPWQDELFNKEKKTLVYTLLVFGLSYGVNFVWGMLCRKAYENNFFACIMLCEVLALFDCITFFFLLMVHNRNFEKQGNLEFGGNVLS